MPRESSGDFDGWSKDGARIESGSVDEQREGNKIAASRPCTPDVAGKNG
jgi:hypothetical protein